MADTVVLTMSEFGRAVNENGNRGTDHGHGNAMLAIGGGVLEAILAAPQLKPQKRTMQRLWTRNQPGREQE